MKIKKFMTAAAFALLGLTASAAYDTTESESLKVWYTDPVTILADGSTVTYLTVYEHDDIDYSAFNMVFMLPEGLRVNQVKSGRDYVDDIKLSERAWADHTISCNIVDGTMLKVACFAPDTSHTFYDTDSEDNPMDELFTVGLVADKGMKPGEYPIELTDIKFVMSDGNACVPADMPVYGIMVVQDPDVNGIWDIEAGCLEEGDCFNLQGVKVNPKGCRGQILIHNGMKIRVK